MNKKITILISSLAVISILAVVSFLIFKSVENKRQVVNENQNVNQNQNTNQVGNREIDTSDWETAIDEDAGVIFKYPRDWNISGSPDGKIIGVSCNYVAKNCERGDFSFGPLYERTELRVMELKNLAELYNIATNEAYPQNKKITDVKRVIIDNKNFYEFSVDGIICIGLTTDNKCSSSIITEGETKIIFLENNSKKFKIIFSNYSKISNKILSTFKFTD